MRAFLTGMPECKFGLNDKISSASSSANSKIGEGESSSSISAASSVNLDDAQFHQCVKLTNFDKNRTINFIPPDGEFELMK